MHSSTHSALGQMAIMIASAVFVFAASINAFAQTVYEAARKEGRLTWYVAQFDVDTAEKIAVGFKQKYPGVGVEIVRATTGVIYQRITQEAEAGVFAADVYSTPEEGHVATLKQRNMLLKYVPQQANQLLPALRGADPDGTYQVTSTWLVLITHNTQRISKEAAPKTWKDLLDPKWKGQIAMGHPGASGSVATWVLQLQNLYGWSYFEQLAKQQPRIGRSINDTVTVLNSGERSIAIGLDSTTLKSRAQGNPIDVIYPADGAVVMMAPTAIMARAPHPNAGKLFFDFMMTKEFSEILVANSYHPIRPDVRPYAGSKPLSETKTVRPPLAELIKRIPEIVEKFRATFGV